MERKDTTPRFTTSQDEIFQNPIVNPQNDIRLKGPSPYDDAPRNEYGGVIGRDC